MASSSNVSTRRSDVVRVAVAGNPNSGKTTLFNVLTGARLKTGNYPGVTVDVTSGERRHKGGELVFYDLPGAYSLSAYSIDELAARRFILEEKPDVVLNVIDSANLERNLYYTLQLRELDVPVVGALNMIDEAEEAGVEIDAERLGEILRTPMVKTVGSKRRGVEELLDAIVETARKDAFRWTPSVYGVEIERAAERALAALGKATTPDETAPTTWAALKIVERDKDETAKWRAVNEGELPDGATEAVEWLERHVGESAPVYFAGQRYGVIRGAVRETVRRVKPPERKTPTSRIDAFALHPVFGVVGFLVVMAAVFYATFTLSEPPVAWLERGFAALGEFAASRIDDPTLRSFVVDGAIGGVGGVLSFAPIIVVLFLLVTLLEESGYMARAAFIMDNVFHRFGLHGQSFIPLFIGFGCTVPAIMAARTLKSPTDRLVTILVSPLISCGARLPIYALIVGAFSPPEYSWAILLGVYALGPIAAMGTALLFRATLFRGETSPFVMELPPYRKPTMSGAMWHVGRRLWRFLKNAGTVIFAASILVWALTAFPRPAADATAREALEQSYAAQMGEAIAPAMAPLGLDWKAGVALVSGLAAKEIVVSTMGVLYHAEEAAPDATLRERLRDDGSFDALSAISLVVFVALYVPCFATLATIRRETGSWKWVAFVAGYTVALAWIAAFLAHRLGVALL
ncbi:MAG: ferrous iron transport protein B [Ignavibacteriales bacterium]|nr:ferrous iron transport protein B [Ignavibacteriales bacterium]